MTTSVGVPLRVRVAGSKVRPAGSAGVSAGVRVYVNAPSPARGHGQHVRLDLGVLRVDLVDDAGAGGEARRQVRRHLRS